MCQATLRLSQIVRIWVKKDNQRQKRGLTLFLTSQISDQVVKQDPTRKTYRKLAHWTVIKMIKKFQKSKKLSPEFQTS